VCLGKMKGEDKLKELLKQRKERFRKIKSGQEDIKMDKTLQKTVDERDSKLINMILDYAISNHMSLEEIDKCISKISEVYYGNGLIIKE